jgi:hypothetical protein
MLLQLICSGLLVTLIIWLSLATVNGGYLTSPFYVLQLIILLIALWSVYWTVSRLRSWLRLRHTLSLLHTALAQNSPGLPEQAAYFSGEAEPALIPAPDLSQLLALLKLSQVEIVRLRELGLCRDDNSRSRRS